MNHNPIIQKVFVEITVNNKEKAYEIKDDINGFLSIDVFPEIEKYINAIENQLAGHTLQIPRLELNVDVKSSSLNAELKDKIAQLFEEQLSEIVQSGESSREKRESHSKPNWVSNQEKMLQTFIYFLENGYMPWWNSDKESIGFLEPAVSESIFSAPNFQNHMAFILPKQHVQDRIINQLSDEQIIQLCLKILENKELSSHLTIEKIHDLPRLNHPEKTFIWRLVLQVLIKYLNSSETHAKEYLLEQISKEIPPGFSKKKDNDKKWKIVAGIFPFVTVDEIAENIENAKKTGAIADYEHIINNAKGDHEDLKTAAEIINRNNEEIQGDGILNEGQYVQNAGLILIHPFIKTFFEHSDLLNSENQTLTDPELGAHLLHYIATGQTNAPEYEMIFEKFLCNIPLHQSINRHIKLSRKHKTQAKNVIESVQHNWSPMKKSSAALLQNEFFQRPGKLVVADHDYILTVERKTQDILLEKLAWGIGLVKLPWKEKFMFVNW